MTKPLAALELEDLKEAAFKFLEHLSKTGIPELYGVTDGKAVGTYVEAAFRAHLSQLFSFKPGNAALGSDFPSLGVDLKVTSVKQPQSSCPFSSASQKVYGLGYHLLVFVYEKADDVANKVARLIFRHGLFIEKQRTADYQTTRGLISILDRDGNKDDIVAFLEERNLPLDEIGREALAKEILKKRPVLGVLTMSNALQWRLQYGRAITVAGVEAGVQKLL